MPDIEVQIENSKKNRDELLNALFERDGWSIGMRKEIPGGGTITLERVPLQKGPGPETFITIVLSFGSGVASSLVANWLSKKFLSSGQTKIRVSRTEIDVTPDAFTKIVEDTIEVERRGA